MNVQEGLLRAKIDPSLTIANLSRISGAALGTSVEATGYEVLTGGCWNRVIAVHLDGDYDDVVCKISPEAGNAGLEREYRVLEYFAGHTRMPVPRPLLSDLTGETIPGSLLVMSRVPGTVMHQMYSYLDNDARGSITDQIAEYVADLHESKDRGFGGVEIPEDERSKSWGAFWLPRFDRVIDDVTGGTEVSAQLLKKIREIRPQFDSVLEIGEVATATHYDIWSGNVMIQTEGSKPVVSGFIDIPGFFADAAREISFMMMFGVADGRFFETYLPRHRPDPGFELRMNLYNLKMNIKHITMYPNESFYRHGARDCLDYIRRQV